jgi:hypothetical protein
MNTGLKAGAVGALTLAGMAAHASIALPSSGSSDAVLFAEVLNSAGTAAVASYAGDTGVSINTLAAGGYSGTVLGSDQNLQKLLAADTAGSGDTLEFAVLGGQYTGQATAPNFETGGNNQFLTTTTFDGTASLKNDTTNSLTKFAQINTIIGTVNSNSGGASSIEGGLAENAGVWDPTVPGGSNLAYWNNGATSNANIAGGTQALFYVTSVASQSPVTKVAYSEVETVSLSTTAGGGLTFAALGGGTTSTPPVPLPAAVWLLGSGLLGFAGVARRKSKV